MLRKLASRRLSTFRARTLREIVGQPGAPNTAGVLLAKASSYETLSVEVSNSVAVVKLNRPRKQNAFNMPMWEEIIDCFDAVSADPLVRVAILGGSGSNFCAGMDLGVFAEMKVLQLSI